MKKLLLLSAIVSFTATALAQGKSQKKEQVKTVKTNKNSNVNTNHNNNRNHDNHIINNNGHDGVYPSNQNTTAKYSKNLPTNVRSSFTRDYPNATNVSWTKNQGSWIATFLNGYYRTSVTYSANGERTNTTRRRSRS